MMYNANGNITLRDDNAVAVFNTSTSHRCVYGSMGFNRGTHEWRITVLHRPCCAYIGVATDARLGTYDTFVDQGTCVGVNNFSGVRNAGSDTGTEVG